MESTDILLPPFHRGGTDRQGRECGGRMMIARYSPTTRCSLCIEGPCSMCHTMFAVELPLGYYELVKNMCDELACLAAPARWSLSRTLTVAFFVWPSFTPV